jgi:hypothetical protein
MPVAIKSPSCEERIVLACVGVRPRAVKVSENVLKTSATSISDESEGECV